MPVENGSQDMRFQAPPRGAFRPHIMSCNGMVSAGHYLAAWWGAEILRRGGNAADAGVAAGLIINVVNNDQASFSGVAPVIYFDQARQAVKALSGVGRWPAAIDVDAIRAQYGKDLPPGPLRSVVPAAPDAWLTALEQFGSLSWPEVAEYPTRLAREGFPVHHFMDQSFARHGEGFRKWEENARIYLRNGEVPRSGELLVQTDLAGLFDRLTQAASDGAGRGSSEDARKSGLRAARQEFYQGSIAHEIVRCYRGHGSWLTEDDFASFRVGAEPPQMVSAWGLEFWGCGPWSQGPALLMAVNILQHVELARFEPLSPPMLHYLVEALKLAFADLEAYCGDPDFVDVPMEALLAPAYGALRAGLIEPERAFPDVPPYGDPLKMIAAAGHLADLQTRPDPPPFFAEPDTNFVCAIDGAGNMFAATPSDGNSGNPIVPGLGINVSSRGAQTRVEPGYPNSLAPGKRPRLTPNPALVTRGGTPYAVIGTPGNTRQPQTMLQVLLYMELYGMPPQQAIEMPRVASYSFPATSYPHGYEPGLLKVEGDMPPSVTRTLASYGHRIEETAAWNLDMGGVCAIRRDPGTGILWGGADPRWESYCIGW